MFFLRKLIFFASIFAVSCAVASAQETGGVKGKVRNTKNDGIPEVNVTVSQDGKEIKSARTNQTGEFLIDGLKTGKYTLSFNKSGFSSGSINNVEVKKKTIRNISKKLILGTDEGTLVLIKGSVFNQDGRSLYGVKVEVEKLSGGSSDKVKDYYTSESGEFTFRFAEGAAKYRVTASAKGKSASKEIEVSNAAIYRLALTLNMDREN